MAQGREREERATEAEAFRACAQLWAERPVGRAVREERERNSAGLRPGTVRGFSFYSFHRQQNKKKQRIIKIIYRHIIYQNFQKNIS